MTSARSPLNVLTLLAVLCVGTPRSAVAQVREASLARAAVAAPSLDNPYTLAEVGLGVLTLPTTDICLTDPSSCTKGDTSPFGYVWMLYRPNSTYAIGAGASYLPPVGSDTPQRGFSELDRTHTRQYLLIDVIGRYYALHLDTVDGWLGMTAGGVVVSDRYKTNAENPSAPILGPTGIAIRTEGLTAGLAAGVGWNFALNWTVESSFRTAWWFLPSEKACAATGDCATLSDDVAMFTLSIGVGYRIAL